jgi:hypothetical protein
MTSDFAARCAEGLRLSAAEPHLTTSSAPPGRHGLPAAQKGRNQTILPGKPEAFPGVSTFRMRTPPAPASRFPQGDSRAVWRLTVNWREPPRSLAQRLQFERGLRLCDPEVATINLSWESTVGSPPKANPTATKGLTVAPLTEARQRRFGRIRSAWRFEARFVLPPFR